MSLLLNRIHELGELVPEAPAVAFVDERGSVTESMSRADVVRDMAEMAAFLRLNCGLAPGDRALLVYPPGLDFIRALVRLPGRWRSGGAGISTRPNQRAQLD